MLLDLNSVPNIVQTAKTCRLLQAHIKGRLWATDLLKPAELLHDL